MASQKKTAGDSGQSGFQNLIDSSKQSFEEPAGGIQQPVLFDSAEAERKSGNKNLGTAETTGSNRPAFQPSQQELDPSRPMSGPSSTAFGPKNDAMAGHGGAGMPGRKV